jgi:hypothetical protein
MSQLKVSIHLTEYRVSHLTVRIHLTQYKVSHLKVSLHLTEYRMSHVKVSINLPEYRVLHPQDNNLPPVTSSKAHCRYSPATNNHDNINSSLYILNKPLNKVYDMNESKLSNDVDKAPANPAATAAPQTYKILKFVVDSFRMDPVLVIANSSLYPCCESWENLRQKFKRVPDYRVTGGHPSRISTPIELITLSSTNDT